MYAIIGSPLFTTNPAMSIVGCCGGEFGIDDVATTGAATVIPSRHGYCLCEKVSAFSKIRHSQRSA